MSHYDKEYLKSILSEEIRREQIRINFYRLDEVAFSKLMTYHFDKGFILISADRTCEAEMNKGKDYICTPKEEAHQGGINRENELKMRKDIRNSGYSYIPMYGGYKEKAGKDPETGEETFIDSPEPEKSFFIPFTAGPSTYKTGNPENIEAFKDFGVQLTRKYKQDSFFFKPPNSIDTNSYWIDRVGKIDMTFGGKTKISDVVERFFSQLRKGSKFKRFSIKESVFYIKRPPNHVQEARKRYGEYFIRIKELD